VDVARHEAGLVVVLALVVGAVAWAVGRRILRPGRAVALVTALAVADMARAGAGLNPQVHASFFDPLPEIAALRSTTSTAGASSRTGWTRARRSGSS
jgi:hypothetical protein